MAEKIYQTYSQLLDKLRNRGLEIENTDDAMQILQKENYYNVINGYKQWFLCTPASNSIEEQYKSGTTFQELYALYRFDREVRHIYLKYLLQIENSLKSVISHEFSSQYGHDNYLRLSHFQTASSEHSSAEKNTASVIKLIGDIQQEIARQMNKHHDVVTHYMTEHGYIPLWVLVNVLTFGKITNFYSNMKPSDQICVAKNFGVPAKELHKYMVMLGLARNKCAHDERFFNIRFRQSLHTKSIKNFRKLALTPTDSGSYISGTNDAYAIAIIFAQLLPQKDLVDFIQAMQIAFSNLSQNLHALSLNDIQKIMGYPFDWKRISLLK